MLLPSWMLGKWLRVSNTVLFQVGVLYCKKYSPPNSSLKITAGSHNTAPTRPNNSSNRVILTLESVTFCTRDDPTCFWNLYNTHPTWQDRQMESCHWPRSTNQSPFTTSLHFVQVRGPHGNNRNCSAVFGRIDEHCRTLVPPEVQPKVYTNVMDATWFEHKPIFFLNFGKINWILGVVTLTRFELK